MKSKTVSKLGKQKWWSKEYAPAENNKAISWTLWGLSALFVMLLCLIL